MYLHIDGIPQHFIDLRTYREQHQLPANFNLALFESKNYAGLGSIEGAGAALLHMQKTLIAQLPTYHAPTQWLMAHPDLETLFREALLDINDQVGLRDSEVDFAVAGFGDVLSAWLYALIYASTSNAPPPLFAGVYAEWLNSTVRLTHTIHTYPHAGEQWAIQLINHAYGRIGMQIRRGAEVDYVYDGRLACPAEHFMEGLLGMVATHIQAAVGF